MKRRLVVVGLLVAVLAVAGAVVGDDRPLRVIQFANIPAGTLEVDVTIFADVLVEVANYLNDTGELPFRVEFGMYVCLDYAAVIQALKYGTVDMVRLGPASYVIANEQCGAVPVVSEIKANTGHNWYTGLILVRQDSDIYGLCSCFDYSDRTIIFTEESSTSGYQAPVLLLKRAGLDLDSFGSVYYSGGQEAALIALVNGYGDIACVAVNRYNTAMDHGVFGLNELRTIAVTPAMPTSCIAVKTNFFDVIPADLLERAWSAVSEETALAYKLLGFLPVDDSAYDPIREIAEALGL